MASSIMAWRGSALPVLIAILASILTPSAAHATPGFARQSGLACEACHTVFPELTPFGRLFKLNGYVFTNVRQLQAITEERERTLALSELPPLAVQLQASNTTLGRSLPDQGPGVTDTSQRNSTQFPQALSLFYTGKISDNLGAFLQLTWTPNNNSVGIDNSDLRFANHGDIPALRTNDFIYGITLNNNPTSQDVWNSTPAWSYPFIASNVVPTPIAKTLIDGELAQQVAGIGGYLYLFNHLYIELSGYRSAKTTFTNSFTGGPGPIDSTADGTNISGIAPYWRVAWEQDWNRNALSFGTFGIKADTHPGVALPEAGGVGFHGPSDTFTDAALDAQYQYIGDDHLFSAYALWIHEWRQFNATPTLHSDTLDTVRLTGSYFYRRKFGGSVQFFSTTGRSDSLLYAPALVVGSANGSPNTQGGIIELDYLPWLNTKLGIQYTGYLKFNGSSSNYDASGRSASDNNTLFVFIWTAF